MNDAVHVRCTSSRRTATVLRRRACSVTDIDAIAAYCEPLDRCSFVPIEELDTRPAIQLRVSPTRNNQHAGVNWPNDFSLERLQSVALGP